MRRNVRLTSAVKMDNPYPVCGDKDAVLDLPESAAIFLVGQQLAQYHGPAPQPVPTRAALEQQEAAIAAQDPSEAPEETGPPKRPYGNAPKSAWIRYAVAVDPDLTPERAEGESKASLMSKYGERL